MTNEEFSNEFDTLLSSYSVTTPFGVPNSIAPIELDEYEKSIYLTEAQEQIVKELYNSFERTENVRKYLEALVKTYTTTEKANENNIGLSKNSVFYNVPSDLMYTVYESVTFSDEDPCINEKDAIVIPITTDDYYRIYRNPFRGPSSNKVLRVDYSLGVVELISIYTISKYLVRYISKPNPIILINLPNNLSIDGISTESECKLAPSIHRAILERAVLLALNSKARYSNNNQQNQE